MLVFIFDFSKTIQDIIIFNWLIMKLFINMKLQEMRSQKKPFLLSCFANGPVDIKMNYKVPYSIRTTIFWKQGTQWAGKRKKAKDNLQTGLFNCCFLQVENLYLVLVSFFVSFIKNYMHTAEKYMTQVYRLAISGPLLTQGFVDTYILEDERNKTYW